MHLGICPSQGNPEIQTHHCELTGRRNKEVRNGDDCWRFELDVSWVLVDSKNRPWGCKKKNLLSSISSIFWGGNAWSIDPVVLGWLEWLVGRWIPWIPWHAARLSSHGSSVVMVGIKLDTRWIKLPYGYLTYPWYRWPIEIVGLPIKNGDFPVVWVITRWYNLDPS